MDINVFQAAELALGALVGLLSHRDLSSYDFVVFSGCIADPQAWEPQPDKRLVSLSGSSSENTNADVLPSRPRERASVSEPSRESGEPPEPVQNGGAGGLSTEPSKVSGGDRRDYSSVKQALIDWGRPGDYKVFAKVRKKHPWIRFDPTAPPSRPRVHAGDWAEFRSLPMDQGFAVDLNHISLGDLPEHVTDALLQQAQEQVLAVETAKKNRL